MADDHLDGEVQAAAGPRLTGIMVVDLFEDVPDLATGRPLCGVQRRLTSLSSSSPNAVCAAAAALALHHRPGRPPPTGDRPSRREHRNPSRAERASPGQYRRTPSRPPRSPSPTAVSWPSAPHPCCPGPQMSCNGYWPTLTGHCRTVRRRALPAGERHPPQRRDPPPRPHPAPPRGPGRRVASRPPPRSRRHGAPHTHHQLIGWGVDEETTYTTELIVSELVTTPSATAPRLCTCGSSRTAH